PPCRAPRAAATVKREEASLCYNAWRRGGANSMERLLQPKTWFILAAVVLAAIYRAPLGATLLPFFMAFLLAMLIDPAVAWVQGRTRLPRAVAVLAVLLLVIVASLGLMSVIFVRVVGDLINLAGLLPG